MDDDYNIWIEYLNYIEKDLSNKLKISDYNKKIKIKYIIPDINLNINNFINSILGIYLDYKYLYNFEYKYKVIENISSSILFEIIFNS